MPRPRTTAKGFPVAPEDCRAVRHLPGPEFKVYDQMVAYAYAGRKSREGKEATGPLLFTAAFKPTLCNALALSVNQTYAMRDRLEKLGWIELVADGGKRDDGTDAPDTWRIVEHDEFVKTHPDTCPDNPEPEKPAQRQERRTRQASVDGRARIARMIRDWTTPESHALADAMAKFTDADWAAVREHWGLSEEEWERVRPNKPVPTDRDRTSPYETGQPVPTKQGDQYLRVGTDTLTTPVTTPVTTPHTHNPPPVSRVGVSGAAAMDAEKEVAELLKEFVKRNQGEPGQLSRTQRQDMKALATLHGRETFRAAARAWLAAGKWNSKTTHPFAGFISGFEGYAAAARQEPKKTLTPEQIAETYEIARQQREAMWGGDDSSKDEPPADALFEE
jgi:hypothetical protein